MSTSTCHATSPKLTPQDDVSCHINIHMSCHIMFPHQSKPTEVVDGRWSGRPIWGSVFDSHRGSSIVDGSMVGHQQISEEFHSPMNIIDDDGRIGDLELCANRLSGKWVDGRRSGRQFGESVVHTKGKHRSSMVDVVRSMTHISCDLRSTTSYLKGCYSSKTINFMRNFVVFEGH
jgi:hypothetical protein